MDQLQDGNGAIYPLAKDCNDGIRDPMWLNLPPIRCLGMRVQSLGNTLLNQKNKAAVIVLAVEVSQSVPSLNMYNTHWCRHSVPSLHVYNMHWCRQSVLSLGVKIRISVDNQYRL